MPAPRQVVDYALRRRALLADVRAGRAALGEVCDASPYLLQAARFHGEPTGVECPVCAKSSLSQVSWIFGDALRGSAGSARRPAEIDLLAQHHGEFSVYVVEVCVGCGWNHLVLSYLAGGSPDRAPRRPDRRRTAAE